LWSLITGGEVFASPVLADIDADGLLEVIIGSGDGYLYTLNAEDGSDAFGFGPVQLPGPILSTATWADLDGNGTGEIAVSCTEEGPDNQLTGLVYVFETGAPFSPSGEVWPTFRQNSHRTGYPGTGSK